MTNIKIGDELYQIEHMPSDSDKSVYFVHTTERNETMAKNNIAFIFSKDESYSQEEYDDKRSQVPTHVEDVFHPYHTIEKLDSGYRYTLITPNND